MDAEPSRVAVDTNVLFRILADDPGAPAQCAAARAAVARFKAVWVPFVVLVELVWVLARAARLSRPEIVATLDHLLTNRVFEVESRDQVQAALADWRESGADFADHLILRSARSRGAPLLSFDQRLQREPDVLAVS